MCGARLVVLCVRIINLWMFLLFDFCSYCKRLLPAATKLRPRLCFYTCVWFCSRGGVSGQGETPLAGRTPPPGSRHPPGAGRTPWEQTPPEQTPPLPGSRHNPPPEQTPPPGSRHPPSRHPPGADTPPPADCSIRSMSDRYATYWNAFLFTCISSASVTLYITQECIPVGCVPPAAVSVGRGGSVCSRRRLVSQHALRQTPPPVNRMTDRCKNITLPLRAVIIRETEVNLHWTNAKVNFFFDLCRCSMWTLNWILYEAISNRCDFHYERTFSWFVRSCYVTTVSEKVRF